MQPVVAIAAVVQPDVEVTKVEIAQGLQAGIVGQRRITSYNVCYTKLLRIEETQDERDNLALPREKCGSVEARKGE